MHHHIIHVIHEKSHCNLFNPLQIHYNPLQSIIIPDPHSYPELLHIHTIRVRINPRSQLVRSSSWHLPHRCPTIWLAGSISSPLSALLWARLYLCGACFFSAGILACHRSPSRGVENLTQKTSDFGVDFSRKPSCFGAMIRVSHFDPYTYCMLITHNDFKPREGIKNSLESWINIHTVIT